MYLRGKNDETDNRNGEEGVGARFDQNTLYFV